jgi:hypothetical protein
MDRSRPVTPAICLVPALSLLLASGCTCRPEILIIRNPSADLSYRRFAFSDPLTTDESLYSLIISARLRKAARAELERRNYLYDERNPDIHVDFSLQAMNYSVKRPTPPSLSLAPLALSDLDTVDYRQGTLRVEVTDARTNVLAWRGKAEGRISRKWIENPGEEVDRIVGDLFVAFPLSARDGQLASTLGRKPVKTTSSEPASVARDAERLEPVARTELR